MIVEFLGISGVGKSYVATQYCNYLEDKGVSYVWPWRSIYSKGYISRNLKKSFAVLWEMITSPQWCCRLFRYLHQQGINGKRDLPVLFFNGIYLHHALENYDSVDGVALFDEGLAQYLWAVHFRNRKPITHIEMDNVKGLFKLPQTLYVVMANSDVILRRMEERNVRDEIRERGDAMAEIENGQRMVDMVSKTLASELGAEVEIIENNDNRTPKGGFIHFFEKHNIV